MFIIIEGPDRVGKDTLIKSIKNYYNNVIFQTLHFSNVKHSTKEDTILYNEKLYKNMFDIMLYIMLYNISQNENFGIICNRSHLGEMVYGPLYRGYSGDYVLRIERLYKIFLNLWQKLALVVLIDKPENLIARDDGQSFTADLALKQKEIDLFKQAYERTSIKNKLLVDISNLSIIDVQQKVIAFLNSI